MPGRQKGRAAGSHRGSCTLLAVTLALSLLCALALACTVEDIAVEPAAIKPHLPPISTALTLEGMKAHVHDLYHLNDWRSPFNHYLSCVDSRVPQDVLGTPGGDFAELNAAIVVYLNMTEQQPLANNTLEDKVSDIFESFMDQVASIRRPFYLHTSVEKLTKMFHEIPSAKDLEPTQLPEMAPPEGPERELWMEKLTEAHFQGCGHVRLMMEKPTDYGMADASIPKALLRAFYNYWWPTPLDSEQRAKMEFEVHEGPLAGRAIAMVQGAGVCAGKLAPAVPPKHSGNQAFIYHPRVAEVFRAKMLAPWFVEYAARHNKTLDRDEFVSNLAALQSKQLNAMLVNLSPANAVPLLYTVTINSTGQIAEDSLGHPWGQDTSQESQDLRADAQARLQNDTTTAASNAAANIGGSRAVSGAGRPVTSGAPAAAAAAAALLLGALLVVL